MTQLSLGDLLQRARRNKNLTREQVARQLHVQPQVLTLFEHNDFNKLNVPERFVLQHLADYANLVDLDAEAVLDIYHQGGVINLAPSVDEIIDSSTPISTAPVKHISGAVEAIVEKNETTAKPPEPVITTKKKVKKELNRITARAPSSLTSNQSIATPKISLSASKTDSKLSPSDSSDKKKKNSQSQAGISAVCEEVTIETSPPLLKSETRKTKPPRKSSRALRWSINLIILIAVIVAAFFWYKEQVGQLKVSHAPDTSQAENKLTPFAKPSAAEQQAAEKMKLEQHIQSNEAMAAQYKILKVPPQSQGTDQS
ncbi:helix-turn-helix domain-containing protein [Piscirickettsia litoralis]|uniref:HTH cro/C1-type domain-containing protein n=1 Tax=Piscirickettsia litoralis TaxID=1891921 RepID=A0ABX3A5J6_9GAMM|nr:helix-turn-helix domain-containing protein [Piscirickettsia litoralis]ODN43800.1 hypothetical protein BGC07_13960 [Piscirickettsia litoralis]